MLLGHEMEICRYPDFRDPTGKFTPVHWKVLALKLSFVIIFEHVVFGICKLIDLLVPDIPESLDIKVKRERYLAKEALQDAEHVLQVKCLSIPYSREKAPRPLLVLGGPKIGPYLS